MDQKQVGLRAAGRGLVGRLLFLSASPLRLFIRFADGIIEFPCPIHGVDHHKGEGALPVFFLDERGDLGNLLRCVSRRGTRSLDGLLRLQPLPERRYFPVIILKFTICEGAYLVLEIDRL